MRTWRAHQVAGWFLFIYFFVPRIVFFKSSFRSRLFQFSRFGNGDPNGRWPQNGGSSSPEKVTEGQKQKKNEQIKKKNESLNEIGEHLQQSGRTATKTRFKNFNNNNNNSNNSDNSNSNKTRYDFPFSSPRSPLSATLMTRIFFLRCVCVCVLSVLSVFFCCQRRRSGRRRKMNGGQPPLDGHRERKETENTPWPQRRN